MTLPEPVFQLPMKTYQDLAQTRAAIDTTEDLTVLRDAVKFLAHENAVLKANVANLVKGYSR